MRPNKPEIDKFMEDNQGKHFCKICNKPLKIERRHSRKGVPTLCSNKCMGKAKMGVNNPRFGKPGFWAGKTRPKEFGEKISKAVGGKNHHMWGKSTPLSTREKISKSCMGKNSGENNGMFGVTGEKSPTFGTTGEKSPMFGRTGEKSPGWKGGVSFEPYYPKFNNKIKEEVREAHGRICVICKKTEEENGEKLCVHYVDYNKDQGCKENIWKLVPLCRICHIKTNNDREYWERVLMKEVRI